MNFIFSSDDDSEPDENNNPIEEQLPIQVLDHGGQNYFNILTDKQFMDRFRFDKNTTLQLFNRLNHHFELFTKRYSYFDVLFFIFRNEFKVLFLMKK